MDYTWHYESPLGGITLASDGESLVGLWFDGQKHFADVLEKEHQEKPPVDYFLEYKRQTGKDLATGKYISQ